MSIVAIKIIRITMNTDTITDSIEKPIVDTNMQHFMTALNEAGVMEMNSESADSLATAIQSFSATQTGSAPKKSSKPRVPRELPSHADRCEARTWGQKEERGTGPQCKEKKKDGCNGLCAKCFKKEQVCAVPMTLDEDGKKVGLFWGRKYKDGVEQPLQYLTPDKNRVAVIWVGNSAAAEAAKAAIRGGKEFAGAAPYLHQVPVEFGGVRREPSKKIRSVKKSGVSDQDGRRVKNPYMRWLQENRDRIKADLISQQRDSAIGNIAKEAGVQWKALSEEERAPYQKAYLADREKLQENSEATSISESHAIVQENSEGASISESYEIVSDETNEEHAAKYPPEKGFIDMNTMTQTHPSPPQEDPAAQSDESENGLTAEKISSMKVKELRESCEKYGLDSKGLKAALQERLNQYILASASTLVGEEKNETEDDDDSEEEDDGRFPDGWADPPSSPSSAEDHDIVELLHGEDDEDDDDEEVEEYTLGDGTKIFVDSDGDAFDSNTYAHLGKWNKETKEVKKE